MPILVSSRIFGQSPELMGLGEQPRTWDGIINKACKLPFFLPVAANKLKQQQHAEEPPFRN